MENKLQQLTIARRDFLHTALGVSTLLATSPAQAVPSAPALLAAKPNIHWIHGNSANIVGLVEQDSAQGSARIVRGNSFSMLPMHFNLAVPAGAQLQAIWLRMQAQAGAHISALVLHDCEVLLSRVDDLQLRSPAWCDVRIATPCTVVRSLGLTLECRFQDVARELGISAVGCEFLPATI